MSSLMLIGLFCITGSEFKALESDINKMNTVIASQHRIKNPEKMPKTNKQVTLEQYLTEEERNALAKGLAESSDGVYDSCNVAVTGNTLTITFVMDSYVVGRGVTAETFTDHLEELTYPSAKANGILASPCGCTIWYLLLQYLIATYIHSTSVTFRASLGS